jgi:hypothetical protein
MIDGFIRTCATCRWWVPRGATIAQAQRNPAVPINVGTCQARSPQVVRTVFGAQGFWPETHADRYCGEYFPDDFDDGGPGGGEQVPADNVVPLRDAA